MHVRPGWEKLFTHIIFRTEVSKDKNHRLLVLCVSDISKVLSWCYCTVILSGYYLISFYHVSSCL